MGISIHIAHDYCHELDNSTMGECARWGPNVAIAKERVLNYPHRVENLYFVFAVLLRAVIKAGARIEAAVPRDESTYDMELAKWRQELMPNVQKLDELCPVMFDESVLFEDLADKTLREEIEERLLELLEIMKCVGCDRCKLWGTLQALGIQTAFKILFPFHDNNLNVISRQEAVALTHTLERFSSSLTYMDELQILFEKENDFI